MQCDTEDISSPNYYELAELPREEGIVAHDRRSAAPSVLKLSENGSADMDKYSRLGSFTIHTD